MNNVEAKALVDTLTDKVVKARIQTLNHTLSNVKPEALVDTLADTVTYSKSKTILGDDETKTLVKTLHHRRTEAKAEKHCETLVDLKPEVRVNLWVTRFQMQGLRDFATHCAKLRPRHWSTPQLTT